MGKARERRAAHRRAGSWSCHYCEKWFTKQERRTITIDHVIPKALGGPNHAWNQVLCCPYCNIKKGDSTYEEFTGNERLPVQCWEHCMTTKEWLNG